MNHINCRKFLLIATLVLGACANLPAPISRERIDEIIASPDRREADRTNAALKSGAMYVIADHSGRPGTGISESGTLHRVEEAFVRKEVEAAGFRLAAEGNFLRNPNDPRDKNTPDPPMPKDEFFLKFAKP